MLPTYDDTKWPLLTVNYRGELDDREIEMHFAHLRQFLQRGAHAQILDMSAGGNGTATQRRRQAE